MLKNIPFASAGVFKSLSPLRNDASLEALSRKVCEFIICTSFQGPMSLAGGPQTGRSTQSCMEAPESSHWCLNFSVSAHGDNNGHSLVVDLQRSLNHP